MAQVTVDIAARIHQRDLRRVADDIQAHLRRTGERSGDDFSRAFAQRATKGITGPGGLIASIGAIGPAAVGAAAVAAGALAAIPAAAAAGAAGFATLTIATKGFGDAIKSMGDPKKFAEGIQKLAPNAQQAALQIQKLAPQLKALQQQTQNRFFDGLNTEIQQLSSRYLPMAERATTAIAGSFNSAAKAFSTELLSPTTAATISSAVDNIVAGFQNLVPAVSPITRAITDLVEVGSRFLPHLGTAIAEAAGDFADFITVAASDGSLQDWISRGIEMVGQFTTTLMDVGGAVMALAPIAQQVFPPILDAISGMAGLLEDHPALVYAVGGAFAAWGVAGVVTSVVGGLTSMGSLLGGLSGIAATAGAGIAAGLGPALAALTAMAAAAGVAGQALLNSGRDIALPAGDVPGMVLSGEQQQAANTPPGVQFGPLGGGPNAQRERRGLPVGAPPVPNIPVPPVIPAAQGAGAGQTGPQVPYPNIDPTSLLQPGMPITSAAYSAAANVLDAQHDVAQKQAELQALIKDTTSSAEDVQKARNAVVEAERDEVQAKLRLAEQQQAATERMADGISAASKNFADIGANLDKDLGFSKGLPGLADNLVRFLASLAAAPLMGQLAAIRDASQPQGQPTTGQSYAPQGYARTPTGNGYPGDAALLANVPAGRYVSQPGVGDLVQGLGDCSSSIEDLVNMMDGKPTAGRSMSTHNAADWLQSRGFLPGQGGPGDMRVAFNPSHMQATLPSGTNFNWGSDAAAAAAGQGGSQGAYDPALTSKFYRPTTSQLTAPTAIAPQQLYGPANTNPALNNPLAGVPGMPGGPLSNGMPQAFPTPGGPQIAPSSFSASYVPTTPAEQAQPSWLPQQGGGGSGLLGMAASAGSMALNGLAPGAGIAAQMGMQAIQRSAKFGGEVAGILAEGIMSTFSVSDPEGGGNGVGSSWLSRIAGGLSGARPAGNSSAGRADEKSRIDPNSPQNQQQQGQQPPGGPTISIGQWVNAENRDGQKMINDLAFASYNSHLNPNG